MHNRFRQSLETKFGIRPPLTRINFNTLEKSIQDALPMTNTAPQAIWEVLGITEVEYYEKYHKQPINENALEIQEGITEEKMQKPAEELPIDTSANIITEEPVVILQHDISENVIIQVFET